MATHYTPLRASESEEKHRAYLEEALRPIGEEVAAENGILDRMWDAVTANNRAEFGRLVKQFAEMKPSQNASPSPPSATSSDT